MKGELKRKTTRTVHGDKVVRLRIDIPYENIQEEGDGNQNLNKWMDMRVDKMLNIEFSDFVDEDQVGLEELSERAEEVENKQVEELTELDEV